MKQGFSATSRSVPKRIGATLSTGSNGGARSSPSTRGHSRRLRHSSPSPSPPCSVSTSSSRRVAPMPANWTSSSSSRQPLAEASGRHSLCTHAPRPEGSATARWSGEATRTPTASTCGWERAQLASDCRAPFLGALLPRWRWRCDRLRWRRTASIRGALCAPLTRKVSPCAAHQHWHRCCAFSSALPSPSHDERRALRCLPVCRDTNVDLLQPPLHCASRVIQRSHSPPLRPANRGGPGAALRPWYWWGGPQSTPSGRQHA